MKNVWIAAILNFFLMGAGYIYNGKRPILGIVWTLCALSLTYVEFGIQEPLPKLYWIMFATVLVANAAFAVDGYNEAKSINQSLESA